jgi:hypothetical protein
MDVRKAVTLARRTTVATIVVALVACTTQSDDTSRPSNPPSADAPGSTASAPETLAPEPRTAADQLEDQDEVIAAVTSAGIRVVAADGSTAYGAVAPVSGIEIGEEQLAGLLAEGEARSGSVGATLDALFDTDIPMSAFLVGYARGADTPAAHLAAGLLEGQDLTHPDRVIFPALVPMLFAADLAHAAGDPDANVVAASAYSSGQLCSSVSASITRGINAVFDALHVNHVDLPKTGIGLLDGILQGMTDLVVAGVNIVVEAGRILVLGLKKFLIDQVLGVVAKVAAIASMVAMFSSYVHKVNLKVDFGAESVWKAVEPSTGTPVTATLTASTDYGYGPVDWPPEFVDCAKEAGAPLTPLKPLGEHVRWSLEATPPDLLRSLRPGVDTLGEGGAGLTTATWDLATGTEKPGLTGEGVEEKATVRASVERTKVKGLIQTLVAMAGHWLASPLPAFIRGPLEAAVTSGVNDLLENFVKLMDLETSRQITVMYHSPDKPPKPKGQHEIWAGNWHNTGYGTDGTFRMDVHRSGAKMTGSIEIYNSDCVTGGQLNAIVDGDQVQFGAIQAGHAITFQGQVKGDQVAGLWSIDAGCGGWSGTWQATITKAK